VLGIAEVALAVPRENKDTEAVLDALFRALASGTRRKILLRLMAGEADVGELTAGTGVTMPAVSRHLVQLEEAGLIVRSVNGRRRVSALKPEMLEPARRWLARIPGEGKQAADMPAAAGRRGSLAESLRQLRESAENP
jgi:DNA-binding transcriptional ArsR family regulator